MSEYAALIRELAVARVVGTPGHASVRDALKRELVARGFVVMEQRFTARLHRPLWGRVPAEAVNLIGVRPRARVTTWLAAHYDSKGQAVSMASRLVLAAACAVAGVAGLGAVAAGSSLLALAPAVLLPVLFTGLSRVSARSPGAVDNGSGLVTVLAALDALPADAPVGVLFPDGEEFGLRGAQALVRERANLLADTVIINFDGVDDRGGVTAFVHEPGPTVDRIVDGLDARRLRWMPVVVDGLALRHAARECVTIMRGDWGTARVVHTPRDTPDRLTLDGAREVASVVARVLGADPTLKGGLGVAQR